MSSRNLKLRAIENGVYDKFHLTRIRFEVPPDLMTTDMGSSYLALRTTLRDSITRAIVDTNQGRNEVPRFFCLGDGETAYDGTALFRTAKLFNKATGQVIEELNYNNQRTNTFKEFTTDFDNLASDTVESGLGIPDSKLPNLQSTYTLWTNAVNNTIDLHVPLKSIFPSLNVPFFQLSAVGGLIVDLELDTTHPLVMAYSNPELVIPPPLVLTSGLIGFNTTEQEEASWLVREQINSRFAPIEKPFAVLRPEYWDFPRIDESVSVEDRYWDSLTGLIYGAPDGEGNHAGITVYRWAPKRKTYTDADLSQLTISPTSADALYYAEISVALEGLDGLSIPFTFADQVVGMAGTDGDLGFAHVHELCRLNTDDVITAEFLELRSPLPPTLHEKDVSAKSIVVVVGGEAEWTSLKDINTAVISDTDVDLMVEAGILTKVGAIITANQDTTFKLYLQHNDVANGHIYMVADEAVEVDGVTTIHTNQKYACPYNDVGERFNVELYAFFEGTHLITFNRSLNLDYVEDDRDAHDFTVIKNTIGGSAKTIAPATTASLFFQDVVFDRPVLESLPHYPSCDLAEMVLVQYPPMKTPMPKFYRTMAVEPFVIPQGMSEIVQNFMLEPNVYNAWVVIPHNSVDEEISTVPSLISGDGNVLRFRATIDEVDVVNRDIQLGEYPDSLYWDKLVDCFSNSAMPMKTLTGTVSGATARPVRVFPVRIYGGLVNGVVSFSNFMKRLQIRFEAPQGESVQHGTAYLFKERYRSWS